MSMKTTTILQDLKNRDIGPYIYNRKTKLTKRERMPFKTLIENYIMFESFLKHFDTTWWVKELLFTESINDEHKYNKFASAQLIPSFIDFYEIDMSAFKREMPSEYTTFNDFFTREVKPERRPVAEPDNMNVITSAADCRLTVFDNVAQAKDLLIKGKRFSLEALVGPNNKDLAQRFENGSCANFRLAPQDYHRFHSPIAGTVTKIYSLGGSVFTTEVSALQSDIDILTENEREIIVIESENVAILYCPISAESVGKVKIFVEEGQSVNRGDILGLFEYGGSDVFCAWNRVIEWDEDVKFHSMKGIETLVEANERIGVMVSEVAESYVNDK